MITPADIDDVKAEAKSLLRTLAPPDHAEKSAFRIFQAARAAGLTCARAKAIWYGEARLIRAEEIEGLRRAAAERAARGLQLRDSNAGQAGEDGTDHDALLVELLELRRRLSRLEAHLGVAPPRGEPPRAGRAALRGDGLGVLAGA